MAKTVLHLGSNLGDRQGNIWLAITHLKKFVGQIDQYSSVYETAAWGLEDQPDFLNIALVCDTHLLPDLLLKTVLDIEQKMGRERKQHWGERIIDIDVLFYNDWKINYPDLIIPHLRIQDRKFVLKPLLEIIPDKIHPVFNKTIRVLTEECTDKLLVRKYNSPDTPPTHTAQSGE